VIGLNNFIQYSHCQVVQLFRLTPLLVKAFTTIVPKHIVCSCVRFSDYGSCLKFIKMIATPFVSFSCWNGFFYDCKCYVYRWSKETSTETKLPIGCLWFTLLAVETYNLNSKLPTQTHQLHHLASKSAFSSLTTSHRKTAVLLKLSNVTFAEFLTSMAKV